MADTTADTTTPDDPALDSVLGALVELMKSGVRPDVLEAQRLLLQRLATQGDVFPSRIPPPLNITEVGGYLNLLERAGQGEMRTSAIASALGIAAPPTTTHLGGDVPVGFAQVSNDRPDGPAQASIPPLFTIRADFHAPLQAAMQTLHAAGVQLPLRAPRAALPVSQPGATPTSLDMSVVLAALGRTLEVFPGTLLTDAAVDPLAIARPDTPATEPFRLVARELDGGSIVPEASWVALRAAATTVAEDAAALRRFLDVAPALQPAGWLHPQPLVLPANASTRGTLATFINVTGLVPGETTLGDELALLYAPAAIARSALATVVGWVWNGTTFAAP